MVVAWNAEDYCASLSGKQRGLNMEVENALLEIFSPLCPVKDVLEDRLPLRSEPALLVDEAGHVLMWYLPGLLSPERQVSHLPLWGSTACLTYCAGRYCPVHRAHQRPVKDEPGTG